eukprot:Nitzschia sp. Nitz4//scaffold473_size5632//469//2538//NITZ4_009212-RA/size5632-augustus-gene-0.1-mRNA-1//1//CDS//3329552700//3065//frame0
MSRHRMVRNLTEDDYYDDDYDDDYYDEEEEEQSNQYSYYAPPQPSVAEVVAPPVTFPTTKPVNAAVPAVAGGVAKPPPGWGKPSAPSPTVGGSNNGGISAPPPGWGKPAAPKPSSTATPASSGISAPPPGWGKPLPPKSNKVTSPAPSGGVSKPPPGWGAPPSSSKAPSKPSTADTKNKPPAAGDFPSLASSGGAGGKTASKANKSNVTPAPAPKSKSKANSVPRKVLPEKFKTSRSQLTMAVLGHVDAGKSTLMGQLLVQTGKVDKREAQKTSNLSWFLDENESERARGVTMEIGTKGVSTKQHDIVILDSPGHADFIPVMITGAATADTAILVVAAVTGEFEAGFSGGGQTKEHALLAKGLGISQIIVAVNKLDVEGWNQERFQGIQDQVQDYLLQQQFKPARIAYVPLSGLTGENVRVRKDPELEKWYKGPTLLEAMDQFKPANRQYDKSLRFIIVDMYAEGKGVMVRGRVAQGFVSVGDRIVLLPVGDVAGVGRLEHVQPPSDNDTDRLSIAMAGDTVDLVLTGIDPMRVAVGNVLADPHWDRPPIATKCQAKLLVMEELTVPIIRGAQVLFHMHSLDVPAVVSKLVALTKRDGSVKKERPRALTSGSSATVELTLSERVVVESFQECRALGRFVLRRGGHTIAVGVIDQVF